MAGRVNIRLYVTREHMEHHDIGRTQFSLCSAMGKGGYTVRDIITAVRLIQMTLVTTGSIWKGTCLPLVKANMMQCREQPASLATLKH